MLISVAICTYQRYGDLAACLASLRQQSLSPDDREILVMDNSPDREHSQRMMAALGDLPGLRWFHVDRPGLSYARNRAIEHARTPLIAFIDDDVTVTPGWLAALVDGFAQFGDTAHSAGGPVRANWPTPPPSWMAADMLPFLSVVDRGGEARLLETEEWVPGANAAYRIDRLRAAGGFRERLGRFGGEEILLSNEDTETTDRMHLAGGRTAWLPQAAVAHRIDVSRLDRGWFRRRFAWQAVSDFMVHPSHHGATARENWAEAAEYIDYTGLPGIEALAIAQTRPDLCQWQMTAVYKLVLSLLAGVKPDTAAPMPAAPQGEENENG
jgi:glycosyltransferase involved in cell wall biosynthesis